MSKLGTILGAMALSLPILLAGCSKQVDSSKNLSSEEDKDRRKAFIKNLPPEQRPKD
jgi:hypothetical protein